jgi:hypothetical protein
MNAKAETNQLLQGWVEEFEEAREVFGVVGALLYFCLLVVLGILGSVVVLIVATLALALLPMAAGVALAAWCASRWQQSSQGGAKPDPLDPGLVE